MKIGFLLRWPKHSIDQPGNVIGDELLAQSLCDSLQRQFNIDAQVYAPNYLPGDTLDYLIYMNDSELLRDIANKHILYLQNAYAESAEAVVRRLCKPEFDGFLFFSTMLRDIFSSQSDKEALFLPFGVDLATFKPDVYDERYGHEVAYIGNDIKGTDRTWDYLYPASYFDFGLYGNWEKVKRPKTKHFWRRFYRDYRYKSCFHRITRGKIPQQDVPTLYSSARINLNCTAQACVDWDVVTLRTYEVMACNGFLISDRVPLAVNNLSNHVVFTRGGRDLRSKIRYYLAHESERRDMAVNGYAYVKQYAAVDVRAQELYDYLVNAIC